MPLNYGGNVMNIKRIFLLITVALFLGLFTACDSKQSNTDNMSSKILSKSIP
jgi:hypothetical protein